MIKIILFLFLSHSLWARTLEVVNQEYNFHDAPEYQAILTVLKSHGDFTVKEKTMSRGEKAVEEAKARNRALLAQMRKEEKEQADTKKGLSQNEIWKEEVRKTHEAWKQEVLETRRQWQKEQDIFLGRLKVYQQNTFELPVKKEEIIEQKVVSRLPTVHIVNQAFTVPIRDQQARPTCSAFSGIRALEILLAQNKQEKDLSEQYFYWASKPNCQKSPCAEKGSWVLSGYQFSQSLPQVDVPLESTCGYKTSPVTENETQVPLGSDCQQGMVQVAGFEEVKTLVDVIEKIKKDVPVVMAARLSDNFFKNQGVVTLEDSSKDLGIKKNGHSQGHAFLAVGVMELPDQMKEREGSYCILIANSWGKGWGSGGYGCLTQNWLEKFRQPSTFIAVNKIKVKE